MIYAKEIQNILRQKYPFIQVDRIIEQVYDRKVVAIKNVTISEPCFQGHFPDEPVLPGVLIVEAMAQAGGFIFTQKGTPQKGVIAAIDKVKFIKEVIPGDTLMIKAEKTSAVAGFSKVSCIVEVDGVVVAKGEITYNFK